MKPNPLQRPSKPQSSQTPISKKVSPPTSKSNSGGGGRQGKGGGKNGGNRGSDNPPPPSPWLDKNNEPQPHETASFVEYLRWLREPDREYKDATKVQILQMAQENANYQKRLTQLNKRTELIANTNFEVKSPWRIRVGGHRGPESILLPAFDALGMPYIPSSTLRGVARNQAIREIMAEQNLDWKTAEKAVAPFFGSLEAKNPADKAGKIVFLDAYPLPSKTGGLAMDMANNIWKWEGDGLKYEPNPNPFLSLEKPTFKIGLRLTSSCQDYEILEKVKNWLIAGLQEGVGSQVNTGYGKLVEPGKERKSDEFLRVAFALEGQLIHGHQNFLDIKQPFKQDKNGNLKPNLSPQPEVRPVAFKSMLRYWFRAFALGVIDATIVKEWEAKLFGGINPRQWGWVKFQVQDGEVKQKEPQPNQSGKNESCGEQEGILALAYSPEVPEAKKTALASLFKSLTWMMFQLGGVGQGARRPCYSRENRDRAPWYRGSTFFIEENDSYWDSPANVKEFQQLFQERLQNFYKSLEKLDKSLEKLTELSINYQSLKTAGPASTQQWTEAIDANCCIVVCTGKEDFGKPYALAVLHSDKLKITDKQGKKIYNGNLCGKIGKEVKPSPVWIADSDDYQVVTIFGATVDPRKTYLETLKDSTSLRNCLQIFPLS